MAKGFVYVLSNAAMPTLLKVGFITKFSSERADELSTSGVPSPFIVEYWCIVENAQSIEQPIHERLHRLRPVTAQDFFNTSIDHAASVV